MVSAITQAFHQLAGGAVTRATGLIRKCAKVIQNATAKPATQANNRAQVRKET